MVRDGYIYGLSLLLVAVLLAWATGSWAWGIAPVLLAAFFLWFFRDPAADDSRRCRADCFAGRRTGDGDGHASPPPRARGSGSASSSASSMCM